MTSIEDVSSTLLNSLSRAWMQRKGKGAIEREGERGRERECIHGIDRAHILPATRRLAINDSAIVARERSSRPLAEDYSGRTRRNEI